MEITDLQPIIDLMTMQEERLIGKIHMVHDIVKETRDQLTKLNGTVREHQTVLDKNLPHTIMHCAQAANIEKIKDALIVEDTTKAINDRSRRNKYDRRVLWIMFAGVIISLGLGILSFAHTRSLPEIREMVNDTKGEVDLINSPVTNTRTGKTYLMPAGMLIDSMKRDTTR